jgi:hypothetical protein
MKKKARVIAFYLPQYHPVPENDEWWGKGFTEWTNTAKACPLYRGHYQPHVPADLGFYDLRLAGTRIAQAEMAIKHGIEAFCYYHYWFAGRRILERPFYEVLSSGEPNFPFCLCWANETWSGVWHGNPSRVLIEQTYPGEEDHRAHFNFLLKAFKDPRYVTVDGKPMFLIYQPKNIPNIVGVIKLWREMATESGLQGLHLVGMDAPQPTKITGFDAYLITQVYPRYDSFAMRKAWSIFNRCLRYFNFPKIYLYKDQVKSFMVNDDYNSDIYPCLLPNWDNTPRSGVRGVVLHGSTPELFRAQVIKAIEKTKEKKLESNIIFVKSWNEWAEGNHLEPDLKYGLSYLDAIREIVLH